MKTKREPDFVEVFAGTAMQAEMVRVLLNDSGIDTYLKDSILGTLVPWHVSPGGAGPVKVMVATPDSEKANIIVAGYES
jgi:hypothetical protein